MSTRGINFLDQWIATNVPETTKADVISVDELTNQLLADAGAIGIKRIEIDEEVDSLYRTLLDAIVHYDPGLPE
ncbi:DUF768 domain-containing protein (plasmid) [Mesorhizobium sp. AR02]|uniref:DUF768 domain-containing protein n=1 Tax=Mesorhizobium sp. AR02 TaxID=2865837 RepID=UPI00215F5C7E|nr:hypothetical protein [Mesorhizobium sp. AR02]UVK57498.1 DUF768 domain-containing protein [Mesorhizobium sp. AR02]